MKTNKIESTKYYCGGYYTIERDGQSEVNINDNVKVKCYVYLPAEKVPYDTCGMPSVLTEKLRFGNRVCVCGNTLHANWGMMPKNNCEYRRQLMQSDSFPTWKDCFEDAQRRAHEELNHLDEMLKAREQALIDAEN